MTESSRSHPAAAPHPGGNAPEFSVSELAGAIKRALEDGFGYVRLKGEISGYRGPHSSGHCYFALKDDKAKIEAVIWRGAFSKLRFRPEEGMEVIAQGRITTYPGSSKYQIVIETLEPAGLGALMALLEERKRKLAAEGLFEAARKRRLPFWPGVVGIVTSPTGAVIRDMLHGFDERCPAHVIVWPVRVQGETSASEVATAIRGFNTLQPGGRVPRPDVLIVARGGGSLEDLWGFNEEAVVRAVAASAIPVISAVGHETDWTLIDLVADARAPTPTKAAEWAVPKHADLVADTDELARRLKIAARRSLEQHRVHLKAAARGLPRPDDLVALPRQRFDRAAAGLRQEFRAGIQRAQTRFASIGGGERLSRALLANTNARSRRLTAIAPRLTPRLVVARIERGDRRLDALTLRMAAALARPTALARSRFERQAGRLRPDALKAVVAVRRRALEGAGNLLSALSYTSVLRRGFALVRDGDGRPVRRAAEIVAGQRIDIELADGRVAAEALSGGEAPAAASVVSEPPQTSHGGVGDPAEPKRIARQRKGPGGGQGSLF